MARTNVNAQSTKPNMRGDIPGIFCWTKMGAEAGQSLDAIRRRKELERRSGNGVFSWGIGNSLGTSANFAKQVSEDGQVDVLFTPMKSAAKSTDSSPSELLLWLSYISADGRVMALPEHMMITSRGGGGKRAHYALLCHSDQDIADCSESSFFNANYAKNLVSSNPVGASQVTSVVRYELDEHLHCEKYYQVAFRAKLHAEGFVKLALPILFTPELKEIYEELSSATTVAKWKRGVQSIRSAAQSIFLEGCSEKDLFHGKELAPQLM